MGLFDTTSEEPRAKMRRYGIMLGAAVVVACLGILWLVFGYFHISERNAANHFFDALSAGKTELAYDLWQPNKKVYKYEDFLADWGPNGIYGPVKSYQIESVSSPPRGGSGVVVVAEVNPYQPFPDANDLPKSRSTKEVRIWVETRDKSLSYPPF